MVDAWLGQAGPRIFPPPPAELKDKGEEKSHFFFLTPLPLMGLLR